MGKAERGRRLLIIDEDRISRIVLKQAYGIRGHAVSVAATAAEGLSAVAADPPEVVVYDWSFRNESGIGLPAKLRAACPTDVVIVALTVMNEEPGFSEREGIDGYIVKPATPDDVERVFEAALARHS